MKDDKAKDKVTSIRRTRRSTMTSRPEFHWGPGGWKMGKEYEEHLEDNDWEKA